MKVVQLLGPSTGGIRRTVVTLADALAGAGVEVSIAGPSGVLDPIGRLDHVVPVPGRPTPIGLAHAARALAAVTRPGDLVHAHGLKAGWVALAARRHPWVLTIHNVVLGDRPLDRLMRRLERFVVARADDVIATSTAIETQFAGVARRITTIRPVHTVPAVVRDDAAVRAALGVSSGRLAVCVGRLHPQKGIDRLLDAWAGVPDDLRLVIVGSGPDEAALVARRDRLGLAGRVEFAGDRADAVELLAAADVVIIPSRWESGPLVLLEALACGRVVVTARVGFVDEVVGAGPRAGVVTVDAEADADDLARAIVGAVTDPVHRAAAPTNAALAEPFLDTAAMVERTLERYRGLTG